MEHFLSDPVVRYGVIYFVTYTFLHFFFLRVIAYILIEQLEVDWDCHYDSWPRWLVAKTWMWGLTERFRIETALVLSVVLSTIIFFSF